MTFHQLTSPDVHVPADYCSDGVGSFTPVHVGVYVLSIMLRPEGPQYQSAIGQRLTQPWHVVSRRPVPDTPPDAGDRIPVGQAVDRGPRRVQEIDLRRWLRDEDWADALLQAALEA